MVWCEMGIFYKGISCSSTAYTRIASYREDVDHIPSMKDADGWDTSQLSLSLQ